MSETAPQQEAPPAKAAMLVARKPTGEMVQIPTSSRDAALEKGYEVFTPERLAETQREEKYGGTKGESLAALAAAGRGVSFGLSDVALTQSGLVKPETLRSLKEVNPSASLGGEMAGQAAGFLLPAVKALGAVGKVAQLGHAATHAATHAIGGRLGTSLAGRVAAKAAPAFLGSAIEGAAYGAGVTISETALGEPGSVAERLISNVGMNALLGGGIGSGLAATGVLAAAAGRSVLGGGAKLFRRTVGGEATSAATAAGKEVASELVDDAVAGAAKAEASTVAEQVIQAADDSPTTGVRQGVKDAADVATDAVLPKAQPSLGDAVAAQYTKATGDTAAPGLAEALTKAKEPSIVDIAARVAGVEDQAATELLYNAAARAEATAGGAARDKLIVRGTETLDNVARVANEVQDSVRGAGKTAKIRAVVKTGNEAEAVAAAQQTLADLQGRAQFLVENQERLGGGTKIKRTVKLIDAYQKEITKIAEAGQDVNAKIYRRLDQLKQKLGGKGFADYGTQRFTSDADGEVTVALRNMLDGDSEAGQMGLRSFLENQELWGKAAEAQQKLNKSWASWLQIKGPAEGMLFRDVGRDATGVLRKADSAKLGGIFDRIHKTDSITDLDQLNQYFNRAKDFLETNRNLYVVDKVADANMQAGIKLISGFQGDLVQRAGELRRLAQLKELSAASPMSGRIVRGLAAMDRTMNAVGKKLEKGFQTALAHSDDQAHQTRQVLRDEAGATRHAIHDASEQMVLPTARRKLAQVTRAAKQLEESSFHHAAHGQVAGHDGPGGGHDAPSSHGHLLSKVGNITASDLTRSALPIAKTVREQDYRDRKEDPRMVAYTKQVQTLQELAARPLSLSGAITHNTRGVQEVAPEVAVNMQLTAGRAVAYMQTLMPKSNQALPPSLQRPLRPTDDQVRKWERATRIINQPMLIMDDLRRGNLTKDSVDAVKAVYPSLYQDMVRSAVEQTAKQKTPINYQNRVQLSLLMGTPLDPSMSPQYQQMVRKAGPPPPEAGGQPQAKAPGRPRVSAALRDSTRGRDMASTTQKTERNF